MKELPFNKVVFNPTRLLIIAELKDRGLGISFQILKKKLELTDGNLASHLRTLKKNDLVEIRKYFKGRYPQTLIYLTTKGHAHHQLLTDWLCDLLGLTEIIGESK